QGARARARRARRARAAAGRAGSGTSIVAPSNRGLQRDRRGLRRRMSHPDLQPVQIGRHAVGPGERVFIVAELGINHNGELGLAKKLIAAAASVGCDAVKFQKRTVDVVYSREELARPRESPYGETNGDLKRGLEFDDAGYEELAAFCDELGM